MHCPFVLVPASGADPIQSPRLAVISRVSVTKGRTVKEGDATLCFALRRDSRLGHRPATMGEDLHTHQEGLAKADAAYASPLEMKKAEIEQAESEVGFRENHAATSRELRHPHGKIGEARR